MDSLSKLRRRKQVETEWLFLWQKEQYFLNWGLDLLFGSMTWTCGGSEGGSWIFVFCWKVVDKLFISSESSWVLIFSRVISSESTILTREWKGIDGSKELETCLTWRLLAKSLIFLGDHEWKFHCI